MSNEPLQIDKIDFMVSSLIDRAPHWTMIRELTKNAIEAAENAGEDKIIHWTTGEYEGTRKAVIWNTGPGLDASQLKTATDLACEINKTLSIDEHFGVGAKVSSLAINREGMRYRSCKDGRVHEVILGYDDDTGNYVRFEREIQNGATDTVIDVTDVVLKEGIRGVDYDWTEVMLLGNSASQDTAIRPFASEPTKKSHVANALYRRFYRLPDGVSIRLDPIYHRFDTTRNFAPTSERYNQFARAETVDSRDLGLRIHYLHDPRVDDRSGLRKSSRGALASTTTTCCLIHKDEMYSVMTGKMWSASAPQFGVPFGSTELCVHIELSDGEARPSQYRERLISRVTGLDIVPEDYSVFVREFMPEWVREVVQKASPRPKEDLRDLERELQDLLDRYKVPVTGLKGDRKDGQPSKKADTGLPIAGDDRGPNPNPDPNPNPNPNRRPGKDRFRQTPEGAKATSEYKMYEKAPKLIMLTEPNDIEEKDIRGKAAKPYVEVGQLFINGLYEAVDRTVTDLLPEFIGAADEEALRSELVLASQNAMAFRVGKATVFALAKRANKDWSEADLKAALTPESLSIAADDYMGSFNAVRREVRARLKALQSNPA